jgi:hypothetical protein
MFITRSKIVAVERNIILMPETVCFFWLVMKPPSGCSFKMGGKITILYYPPHRPVWRSQSLIVFQKKYVSF